MKNKGFTLVELLAVIVILAVISLIATPLILGVIDSEREKAAEQSALSYIQAVENQVVIGQLTSDTTDDIAVGTSYAVENLNIKMKGTMPTKGTVVLDKDGNATSETCLVINMNGTEYNITYDGSGNVSRIDTECGSSSVPTLVSFAEDSWETIVANVKAGNTSKYNVGDTKEIALTGFTNGETDSNGLYTIRIANNSTADECSTDGFSQTACGFVIEFVDIITEYNMNTTETNVGSWRNTAMRTYVNDTIYNALPLDLKENIMDTYVVSGYGSSETSNFTTTDKLYLLSTKEVWGEAIYDTVGSKTRQLDYYKNLGITLSNYSGAIKNYNGSSYDWWLRSAGSSRTDAFVIVHGSGYWRGNIANIASGVAVAFRIG